MLDLPVVGHDRDDVLFSLGILRHSVNQKVRRERMEGIFEEARKIQASILPRRAPHYVIADRFFQAAFGGSFLNHQWLIAARSPVDTSAGPGGAHGPGPGPIPPPRARPPPWVGGGHWNVWNPFLRGGVLS